MSSFHVDTAQPARLVIKISFGFIHHCGKPPTATSPLTAGDMVAAVNEAAQALAFVAKRAASRSLPAARWAHVLSLELGWMTPSQARAYVAGAKSAGLLQEEAEELSFVLDPDSVVMDRRFRPDPQALPEPLPAPVEVQELDEGGFSGWLRTLSSHLGQDAAATMDLVSEIQNRFGGHLGAYPALLIAAQEAGLDTTDAAESELGKLMQSAP